MEFNSRVNYPIKGVLNAMANDDIIDMGDDFTRFSVSTFANKVAAVGIKQVFDSWNLHTIPGNSQYAHTGRIIRCLLTHNYNDIVNTTNLRSKSNTDLLIWRNCWG